MKNPLESIHVRAAIMALIIFGEACACAYWTVVGEIVAIVLIVALAVMVCYIMALVMGPE
jgi:hypothetical protein